ncbi:MAG TPA: class I SAM-dependent methyltransferase [Gemmatimonadales bacterium]|nr:class I SAM-dependent methyltransferase [Gemmatimonadales bacterium]
MHLLDHPVAYRIWQGPFAAQKLVPLQRRLGHGPYGRVLDVACGPGINTATFKGPGYKGIDLNPHYIARATRTHGPLFEVADATKFRGAPGTQYDIVLINSFLHHLDDAQVTTVLDHVRTLLAPGGTVQIMELVRPPTGLFTRMFAALDRGKFARPVEAWRELIGRSLRITHLEPYALGAPGLDLWAMLYVEGVAP